MIDYKYSLCAILIIAAVTIALRAVPFVLLGGKKVSRTVSYLGDALPPAIMAVLVFYCLRGTKLTVFPYGLPEIISLAAAGIVHLWKKNMYVSIIVGTVIYMVLIRTVFAV